ncbi:MAG: hypothetical protein KKD44_26760 [Proteobacteria bacterium]|nr:hypothetical protein [Pseudomonadota bacterium]
MENEKVISKRTKHLIEETIFENSLPVNTVAMLNRLIEILGENNTNGYTLLDEANQFIFRKCLWLVNQQVFGQMGEINMADEWSNLRSMSRIKY